MALSTAIYTILRLNANVVATFGTRIYPVVVPIDSDFPALTYQVTNHQETNTHEVANKFDRIGIRVSVYADSYTTAETYAGYVYTALSRYKGTQSTEKVLTISYDSQSDDIMELSTPTASTTGQYIYIKNMDFTIFRG